MVEVPKQTEIHRSVLLFGWNPSFDTSKGCYWSLVVAGNDIGGAVGGGRRGSVVLAKTIVITIWKDSQKIVPK